MVTEEVNDTINKIVRSESKSKEMHRLSARPWLIFSRRKITISLTSYCTPKITLEYNYNNPKHQLNFFRKKKFLHC